jgi:ABC-type transport system involved in cytochrome bd biosynthesis fused ATPase/permease subunit
MKKIPETLFLQSITVACVTLSFGGVFLSAFVWDSSHGGRGGALAVALALFALFATRNDAVEMYDALTHRGEQLKARILNLTRSTRREDPIRTAEEKLTALEKRLEWEAEGQRVQNFYLALSTAVGTVFWGFGDLFAFWLRIYIYGHT